MGRLGTGQGAPVRIKNLEKVLAHLQVLQHFLETGRPSCAQTRATLSCLLTQLASPETVSFNSAWEIADLLEGELLRIGDCEYIKGIWYTWPRDRIPDRVWKAVAKEEDNKEDTNWVCTLVRPFLQEDQRDLVQEYRRDRAMISLRRSYLNVMGIALLVLNVAFSIFYAAATTATATITPESAAPALCTFAVSMLSLLLFGVTGAIGSAAGRATKLSERTLPSQPSTGKEIPLGIRSLMSAGSVFFAQVMLGVTAGLIVYLVFGSNLLGLKDVATPTPESRIVLAFIAGFSEPFLTDVVGRVSAKVV